MGNKYFITKGGNVIGNAQSNSQYFNITTPPPAPKPIVTGGVVTTDGAYTIHTFTSNGTFTVSNAPLTAATLVVGGGGGAGYGSHTETGSGGGGGGGVSFNTSSTYPIGNHSVIVGAGGNFGSYDGNGFDGNPSSISIHSANGGKGSRYANSTGSSDGGDSGNFRNGGAGSAGRPTIGGGGGGASQAGQDGIQGGNGGNGRSINITGSNVMYGRGGNGGRNNTPTGNGYGFGGHGRVSSSGDYNNEGKDGIVIIRYLTP